MDDNRRLRDLLLELLAPKWPSDDGVNLKLAAEALGIPHTTLHSYVSTSKYGRLPSPGALGDLLGKLGATEKQRAEGRLLLERDDAARRADDTADRLGA